MPAIYIDIDRDNVKIVKLLLFKVIINTINEDRYYHLFWHYYIFCGVYIMNLLNNAY